MGHAYEQGPIHKEADQAGMINRTMDIMEKFTGKRPVGWLGPGLTQTLETPDLLAAAGVKYIGDWVYDDEPTVIRTTHGPLVTLPYTIECNDIPVMIVQHHNSDYLLQAGEGPVRPALCRERDARQDLRARHPPLHQRASRTASNISRRSTTTSTSTRACCTGTARRFSTGTTALPKLGPPRSVFAAAIDQIGQKQREERP